jgi:hypothetical protein
VTQSCCRNCDSPIDDYSECWHCQDTHAELLERLHDRDDAVTMAQVAIVAVHGPQERLERVWWIG